MPKIGVLGVGAMGSGIVQVLSLAGYDVVVRSRQQTSIDKGLAQIKKILGKLVDKDKLAAADRDAALGRITSSTDLAVVADVDVIIEAATEDMAHKKGLFAELDALCRAETIFATNTSSLSISEIASATKRPEKFIGLHFFNPVPLMQLVEVVRGVGTSQATVDSVEEILRRIDKTAVLVQESPGFVVNRILVPMINEAAGILADGVASAADIDQAMKLGANHPMGPLALGDLIGLDICLSVMEVLHAEFGEDKYRPQPLLRKMVRAGRLGRKTGQGFFDYA